MPFYTRRFIWCSGLTSAGAATSEFITLSNRETLEVKLYKERVMDYIGMYLGNSGA